MLTGRLRTADASDSSGVPEEASDKAVKVCDAKRLAEQWDGRPVAKTRVLRHLRTPTHECEALQQARLLAFELAVEPHAVELRHQEVTQDEVV